MCAPPSFLLGKVDLPTKFLKRVAWQDLNFQRGLLGRERQDDLLLGGSSSFYIKNKLKSEIINDKNAYKEKRFLCNN